MLRTPWNCTLLSAAIGLCFLLVGQTATAATDPVKAKQWYDLAIKAYEGGQWINAALAFDAAYEADPAAELLYNSARAYDKGGQLPRALERYQQFLVEKDANSELRKKAMDRMVAIELAQRESERSAADSSAREAEERQAAVERARLAQELAAAEQRRLELEIKLAQERSASAEAPRVEEQPTGPSGLELHRSYTSSKAMVIKGAGGTELTCEPDASPCSFDLPPGMVTVSLKGMRGRGRLAIREGERTYATGKIVTVDKTSAVQIVGIGLVGAGALGILLSYPIALEMGASGDDYLLGFGISAAIGLTGGLLWLLWPPDNEPQFLIREERQTSGLELPSITVGVSPYKDGAILGASGSF